MRNTIIVLLLNFTFIISAAYGSDNIYPTDKPELKLRSSGNAAKMSRIYIGGDIGATFGDYSEIRISPLVGYNFSKYVSGGVKFVYRHSWEKVIPQFGNEYSVQSDAIGGNVYLQYFPVPEFYLKSEYSYQNYKQSTTQNTSETRGVPFLFLGAGYSKLISNNLYFNAGIKVDVLNNTNSPFSDYTPFFEAGITYGI